jgi:peptidylprolyl isomerase
VKPGAFITLHYTGWTVDGNVFDTSKKGAGTPAEFELAKLIPGWQKGIPGMKPGGIRKLVVPPALGYGDLGSPPNIPGNSTLVFEVEFIR